MAQNLRGHDYLIAASLLLLRQLLLLHDCSPCASRCFCFCQLLLLVRASRCFCSRALVSRTTSGHISALSLSVGFPQPIYLLRKMRFTSSNHAKTLLKYTDALPDGMVFDQKLQDQVMRRIIGQEDDEKKAVVEHYALYELNRCLLKKSRNWMSLIQRT